MGFATQIMFSHKISLYLYSYTGKMFCALTLPVEDRILEDLWGSFCWIGSGWNSGSANQESQTQESAREKEAFSWSV